VTAQINQLNECLDTINYKISRYEEDLSGR